MASMTQFESSMRSPLCGSSVGLGQWLDGPPPANQTNMTLDCMTEVRLAISVRKYKINKLALICTHCRHHHFSRGNICTASRFRVIILKLLLQSSLSCQRTRVCCISVNLCHQNTSYSCSVHCTRRAQDILASEVTPKLVPLTLFSVLFSCF